MIRTTTYVSGDGSGFLVSPHHEPFKSPSENIDIAANWENHVGHDVEHTFVIDPVALVAAIIDAASDSARVEIYEITRRAAV